jgi:N-acetylmuramoyl-L-alanine amidase
MEQQIIRRPSPNYSSRSAAIDTLVIHHTDMADVECAIHWLCSPEKKVSSHYVIGADGSIFSLVDEDKKARHAGQSYWRGNEDLNENSIGIELDNSGLVSFPQAQMQALISLCKDIISRYGIKPYNVVAHADIAPNRKIDPSHYFDWKQLAANGIGCYSDIVPAKNDVLYKYGDDSPNIYSLKQGLREFGYLLDLSSNFDRQLMNVIHAFKRRYVPETYGNVFWDMLSELRLNDLLPLYR